MQGWIKLYRSIREHWTWEEKPFSKGQAWIDLIMSASHEDKRFPLGNELVDIERGSFITSIRKLCDRWGWSNTKVRAFLDMLQTDKMIIYKSDTKKTLITIENYSKFQDKEIDETTEKHHENDASQSRKHTIKNYKNYKNEKKSIIMSPDQSKFIDILKQIKYYPLDIEKDIEMFERLTSRYPTVDPIAAIDDYALYKLDHPLDKKSNPRSQINTAFQKCVEWKKCLKKTGQDQERTEEEPKVKVRR